MANNSNPAHEPSMDELLASIREIIEENTEASNTESAQAKSSANGDGSEPKQFFEQNDSSTNNRKKQVDSAMAALAARVGLLSQSKENIVKDKDQDLVFTDASQESECSTSYESRVNLIDHFNLDEFSLDPEKNFHEDYISNINSPESSNESLKTLDAEIDEITANALMGAIIQKNVNDKDESLNELNISSTNTNNKSNDSVHFSQPLKEEDLHIDESSKSNLLNQNINVNEPLQDYLRVEDKDIDQDLQDDRSAHSSQSMRDENLARIDNNTANILNKEINVDKSLQGHLSANGEHLNKNFVAEDNLQELNQESKAALPKGAVVRKNILISMPAQKSNFQAPLSLPLKPLRPKSIIADAQTINLIKKDHAHEPLTENNNLQEENLQPIVQKHVDSSQSHLTDNGTDCISQKISAEAQDMTSQSSSELKEQALDSDFSIDMEQAANVLIKAEVQRQFENMELPFDADFEQRTEDLLRPHIQNWLKNHFSQIFNKILNEEISKVVSAKK